MGKYVKVKKMSFTDFSQKFTTEVMLSEVLLRSIQKVQLKKKCRLGFLFVQN